MDCARSTGAVVELAMFVPYKLDVAFIAFVTTVELTAGALVLTWLASRKDCSCKTHLLRWVTTRARVVS